MTTIVAGTVEFPADKRDAVLTDTKQLIKDTRSQTGCNHYVWAADPTSDTVVYVYESWASTEAFAAHLAGEYYSKMLANLGAYGVGNVEVLKFQVAREQPVYDPEGVPRADFFDE